MSNLCVCVFVCTHAGVYDDKNYCKIFPCYFTGGLYYLLVGKSHMVGRRDADLTLADDQSISRRHAIITIEHNIKNLVRMFKVERFY